MNLDPKQDAGADAILEWVANFASNYSRLLDVDQQVQQNAFGFMRALCVLCVCFVCACVFVRARECSDSLGAALRRSWACPLRNSCR